MSGAAARCWRAPRPTPPPWDATSGGGLHHVVLGCGRRRRSGCPRPAASALPVASSVRRRPACAQSPLPWPPASSARRQPPPHGRYDSSPSHEAAAVLCGLLPGGLDAGFRLSRCNDGGVLWGEKKVTCVLLWWGRDKIREAASCAGNNDNQGRWWGRVRFYLPLRTTDPEHYRFLFHISGFICIWYIWPDGSGPMGRHVDDPKKHDTRTIRHEGDSASGWPGLMVGPGMGRTLGTVARHGHNTIFGLASFGC
jgi:hypothetical protein